MGPSKSSGQVKNTKQLSILPKNIEYDSVNLDSLDFGESFKDFFDPSLAKDD